jgi:hypothetical protein
MVILVRPTNDFAIAYNNNCLLFLDSGSRIKIMLADNYTTNKH